MGVPKASIFSILELNNKELSPVSAYGAFSQSQHID
ncbi:unnamed protein product [Musa textilis]